MKHYIIGTLLTVFLSTTYAENIINTQTNSWKSIPITVDEDNQTYATEKGYLVPEGEYYYTFSGYRCLKAKNDGSGAEPLVLAPSDTKGHKIYCYKDK